MINDELAEHLDALQRDTCYRVDSVLKESPYEVTQKVFFVGTNGAEQGPYVRKYIDSEAGLGCAYEKIFGAQRNGRRFQYLPLIHECYAADDKLAVVMEYIPGETLQEVVYRCDPSLTLAKDIFPRLCDAVEEMHQGFDEPIIHRDLKPSNIMIAKDSLTIIDFGIARTYKESAEEDTHNFGTRAYAPPEQFGYGQTDERSDVYSLGALLYYCLSELTLSAKVQKNKFKGMAIPESLRQILVKATQFDPEDRYQSVAALKDAFWLATACEKDNLGAKKGMLSWVPETLGIIWDIFLVFFFILFQVVAVSMMVNPEIGSSLAALPIGVRAAQVFAATLGFFGPAFYMACDRRPLVKHFSWYRKINLKRDVLICLVIVLLGVLIIGVTGLIWG